jgi:hypothetical protein
MGGSNRPSFFAVRSFGTGLLCSQPSLLQPHQTQVALAWFLGWLRMGTLFICGGQRVGHRSGIDFGGVIVNLGCGDELTGDEFTNDPSIDFQLVVREGLFCRCADRPSSVHESTLQIEYRADYPQNVQQITRRRQSGALLRSWPHLRQGVLGGFLFDSVASPRPLLAALETVLAGIRSDTEGGRAKAGFDSAVASQSSYLLLDSRTEACQ